VVAAVRGRGAPKGGRESRLRGRWADNTAPWDGQRQNGGVSRVTLQTIADRVGVSRMTVSNAFSRPDQLSAKLRDTILAAAADLGYTGPDPSARALARGRVGTVGVLLTDSLDYAFTDDVATRLLAAVSEELTATGFGLTLLTAIGHDGFVPARDIPMDGAIVFSCDEHSDAIGWLRRRQLPLVFVHHAPSDHYPTVNSDDRIGGALAAQHLLDLGHRRVAIITHLEYLAAGEIAPADVLGANHIEAERWHGWVDVLAGKGVEPIVVNAPQSTEAAGEEAGAHLLNLPPRRRPTGVLAFSDRLAAGVMRAAQRYEVAIPSQLSIVGYDDATFAATLSPPLTTVRQDIAGNGHLAAATIAAAIDQGRDRPVAATVTVTPVELVIRSSTARRRTTPTA
jgi:DNA-binding LacI/PurR family transcriptional regulator